MDKRIKTIGFFLRPDNARAIFWERKIQLWIKKRYPFIKFVDANPQVLIVLGGDGTILEAARKYQKRNPIIFGLNLGHIGFLTSAREPEKFLISIDKFLKGEYRLIKKMTLSAVVLRKDKIVFAANSLNEISVQNPLGMVEIEVKIEGYAFQYIRGTGVLVATANGSTAYNLSAHGPIVAPDIKCLILTEILDHNIPTPSIVIKSTNKVSMKILNFRKRGLLSLTKGNKAIDAVLTSDGENIFPLEKNDIIMLRRSRNLIKFVELEKNYFFKSLQEKFAFR